MNISTKILIALVLGLGFGHFLPELTWLYDPVGAIYIRALKALVLPLVFASLMVGVMNIGDSKNLGRLGISSLLTFIISTVLAISLGLGLATIIQPGSNGLNIDAASIDYPVARGLSEALISIVPHNIFAAMVQNQILSVIFISIVMGTALLILGKSGEAFGNVMRSVNEMMMLICDWVIRISPIGIWALIASLMAEFGFGSIRPLLGFMSTVTLGLGIHGLLTLPLLVLFVARRQVFAFFKAVSPAIVTAFSTASSAASLPIALKNLSSAKISKLVISFVMPLGTTVNMNGTALYQAVATVFLAQIYGVELLIGHYLVIIVTALLAAISAAAIPSAGLITLTMILTAVGIPVEGIALILGVDRILDMMRTVINVWGNCCVTAIVQRFNPDAS